MRNLERRGLAHEIAVQNQIQIKRACSAERWTHATAGALQGVQLGEQRVRIERRLPHYHAVEVRGLIVGHIDGLGFDQRRGTEINQEAAEAIDGPLEVRVTVAQIRSECDGDRDRRNYSIHLTPNTPSPVPGDLGPLARRPSSSSRPAAI